MCGILLMDESGSVGLDLSFASHVFLMEPLADASLQAQVESRAHRMGAVQPIHVETLIMQVSNPMASTHNSLQPQDGYALGNQNTFHFKEVASPSTRVFCIYLVQSVARSTKAMPCVRRPTHKLHVGIVNACTRQHQRSQAMSQALPSLSDVCSLPTAMLVRSTLSGQAVSANMAT